MRCVTSQQRVQTAAASRQWALLVVLGLVLLLAACRPAPTAQPWVEGPPLPQPRGEMQVAAMDGRIYVPGGLFSLTARSADSLFILDTSTGSWQQAAPMPLALNHHAVAALDGRIYVFGGSESLVQVEPLAHTFIYDPKTDSWAQGAAMPHGRWGHGAAVLDGHIYLVGGHGPAPEQPFIYNPAADAWQLIASLDDPRDHLGVVAWQGRIYAVGGRWQGENTSRVEVYDPARDAWEAGPSLAVARSGMGVAVSRLGIHALGGEAMQAVGGQVFATHEILREGAASWQPAPALSQGRHGSPAAVMDDTLYVMGGAWRQGAWSVLSWENGVAVLDLRELE